MEELRSRDHREDDAPGRPATVSAANAVATLKERVAHDIESLGREFPDRAVRFETTPTDGGFIIRRGHYPEVRLTVTPHFADCSVRVDYVCATMTGTAAPKM